MWVYEVLVGPQKAPTAFPPFDDYCRFYEYWRMEDGMELVLGSMHQKGMCREEWVPVLWR